MQNILFGIDVFLQQANAFKNIRIGLVTNNAAVTCNGVLNRVALLKQGFRITKLFSPEHGINGTGADGAAQHNHTDAITQLPVISLYGNKLAPDAADLIDIDVVVFDIPDAGCRFYTYLWTMTYVMEAAALYNKPLIILDRPNPTGALIKNAEGPFLDEVHCSSFIGRWSIPVRHCCTLAELALYFNQIKKINVNLSIVKVANYQRHFTAANQFAFTPTSPALQNMHTALLYAGTCLLEGIEVNEGRGTPTPFTVFGAPFFNSTQLLQHWKLQNIDGITAQAVSYTPAQSVYAGQICNGLRLSCSNTATVKPVAAGIALLQVILQLYPAVQERLYYTAANPPGNAHMDKLLGLPQALTLLKSAKAVNTNVHAQWQQTMAPFLLY